MKYVCQICGHVYDEEVEGVKFADLPEDWVCPLCGVDKSNFEQFYSSLGDLAAKPPYRLNAKVPVIDIPAITKRTIQKIYFSHVLVSPANSESLQNNKIIHYPTKE